MLYIVELEFKLGMSYPSCFKYFSSLNPLFWYDIWISKTIEVKILQNINFSFEKCTVNNQEKNFSMCNLEIRSFDFSN